MKNIIYQNENLYKKNSLSYYSSNRILGFWLYLMSDIVVFSILFAVYLVMANNVTQELLNEVIFKKYRVSIETIVLLLSSFSCSLALNKFKRKNECELILLLIITFLLGFAFVCLEILEFNNLIKEGYGPCINSVFSSFFVLLGTHCIHVIIALVWILVMIKQIFYFGFTYNTKIRIVCFSLFWHFLDLVWIFIFSIVYLMGAI